ncbi:MAG TPA: Rrf2 family transcriptional regulator [Anaerohalosphaeraceae bacterium]|jgi:Rrf2 family protein|nr:Rrf2 family transcriptional regulator [Anaerohalosphaeraceae bacterium]HRT50964.1 Rrf2 family transcriptional regulator [Anaerohalosphaeraceae bacterium]HRT86950.1 Rrf2 family transcriptional regulator [Anaerohalosphaeraceae bacterium]
MISVSAKYGLMAAGYLAEHADHEPIMAETIAKECYIPLGYLLKIMQQMVKFNVLSSKRGPGGGFALARPAKDLSLLEIIEAAGGPLAHIGDLTELTIDTPLTRKLEQVCQEASQKAIATFAKAKLSQTLAP